MSSFADPIWEGIFKWATIGAAVFGGFGLAGAFVSAWVGYQITDTVQKDADKRISEANAEAARANQRTEELRKENLLLQKAQLPRRIVVMPGVVSGNDDGIARKKKFDEVEKYKGTRAYIQSVPDFEAQILASDIADALRNSGWEAEVLSHVQSGLSPGFISSGVVVQTLERWPFTTDDPPKPTLIEPSAAWAAAQALVSLLELDLGPPHGPRFFGVHQAPVYRDVSSASFWATLKNMPDDAVVILIGLRPVEWTLSPIGQREADETKGHK